jgi:hypothetical protein
MGDDKGNGNGDEKKKKQHEQPTQRRYAREHWITQWIRSRMYPDEKRRKENEDFQQYAMDRYIEHAVAKSLGLTTRFGTDKNWFAGAPHYQQVTAKAFELYPEVYERQRIRHAYRRGF